MSTSQAIQAQQIHESALLAKANVVGVAVGFKEAKGAATGEVAVIVLVEQKKPLAALSAEDVIPSQLEGMKTDVYEVGYLRAQQVTQDPKGRFRPLISPGVSIGHYKVTAGTFGALVTDKSTGERLILSNNHVLANSNDSLIGDAILQPGAIDGGQNPGDVVATLERFVKLQYIGDPVVAQPPPAPAPGPVPPSPPPTPSPSNGTPTPSGCDIVEVIVTLANAAAALFGSQKRVTSTAAPAQAASVSSAAAADVPVAEADTVSNLVDCAVAKPVNPAMFSDDILQIGKVSGTKPAVLGMRVRKFGRTTGYTEGNITLLNATVNIAYNTIAGQKTARFTGTVVTESMSDGGDSGSLIVDTVENKAVGLLFAGSSLATIFIPIDSVLQALNVMI